MRNDAHGLYDFVIHFYHLYHEMHLLLDLKNIPPNLLPILFSKSAFSIRLYQ